MRIDFRSFVFSSLLFSGIFFHCFQPRCVSAEYFTQDPGEPIVGEALTESDLSGKLVIWVFWGIESQKCRDGLNKMTQVKAWLRDSDDIVIVGSHMQETPEDLGARLEELQCTFTVYDHFVPECAELSEESLKKLPVICLFDEEGKLSARGTPDEILQQLPDAFRKRIEARARQGFRYSPMEEAVFSEEMAHAKPYFAPDRVWRTGFLYLEYLSENEEYEFASEAQVLSDQLQILIYDELERLEELAKLRPGEAAYRLRFLRRNLQGLEADEDAAELWEELSARRGVSAMLSVYTRLEDLKNAVQRREIRPLRMRSSAENVLSWLRYLSRSPQYDEMLRSEAAFLLQIAEETMERL
ncbi:MAG: hypothetical protein E7029_03420 [Planctomycetaceae bacterium]|nr:hypothetical protein [Planctomycetaceae bacterium]